MVQAMACPPESMITWSSVMHINGLVQDCSDSSVLAMELLQSRNNPSMHHQAWRSKQSVPCESIFHMTVFRLHMMSQNDLLFTKFLTWCTSFLYVLRSLHKSENKSERTDFETILFCILCGPITWSMVNAVLWISSNSWVAHQTTHGGKLGCPNHFWVARIIWTYI